MHLLQHPDRHLRVGLRRRQFPRPAATKRLALISKTHHEVLSAYLEVIELAAALAARASLIVSDDRDLLDIGTFRDIRILNAADALRVLSA
jgi:hypothetical protein